MTTIPARLFTAEEFAALDKENLRPELVRGVITAMPPAFTDHGKTAMRLSVILGQYVWLDAGVQLVWVLCASHRLIDVHQAGKAVMTLDDTATLDGLDIVPGFSAPVARIFG